MNQTTLKQFAAGLAIAVCLPLIANGQENEVVRVSNDVNGQVFTMLDNEKAPLIGKVSLTDSEGNTVTSLNTDNKGNFSFKGLKPGTYKAVCVAGDYVGDTEVAVAEGQQQNISLAVAPASGEEVLEAYASLPASSFSAAPVVAAPAAAAVATGGGYSTCNTCNTCNTCSGGYSRGFSRGGGFGGGGFGGGGFGGGGFGGGGFGGGLGGGGLLSNRLVRLGLIGGIIGIAVSDDDPASPDE